MGLFYVKSDEDGLLFTIYRFSVEFPDRWVADFCNKDLADLFCNQLNLMDKVFTEECF